MSRPSSHESKSIRFVVHASMLTQRQWDDTVRLCCQLGNRWLEPSISSWKCILSLSRRVRWRSAGGDFAPYSYEGHSDSYSSAWITINSPESTNQRSCGISWCRNENE